MLKKKTHCIKLKLVQILFLEEYIPIKHDNGARWGRVLPSPSSYPILIYLPFILPIPNGDEKSNLIPVPDGFEDPILIPDPHPRTCSELFFNKKKSFFPTPMEIL